MILLLFSRVGDNRLATIHVILDKCDNYVTI